MLWFVRAYAEAEGTFDPGHPDKRDQPTKNRMPSTQAPISNPWFGMGGSMTRRTGYRARSPVTRAFMFVSALIGGLVAASSANADTIVELYPFLADAVESCRKVWLKTEPERRGACIDPRSGGQ
jgi:hypothetical protein